MKFLSNINIDSPSQETRHKFAKMIIGSIVGFVAAKLAENLYDSITEHHEGMTEEI